jgi:hypothetical protein
VQASCLRRAKLTRASWVAEIAAALGAHAVQGQHFRASGSSGNLATFRTGDGHKYIKATSKAVEYGIGTCLPFAGNLMRPVGIRPCRMHLEARLNNIDIVMKNIFWIGLWPPFGTADAHCRTVKELVN